MDERLLVLSDSQQLSWQRRTSGLLLSAISSSPYYFLVCQLLLLSRGLGCFPQTLFQFLTVSTVPKDLKPLQPIRQNPCNACWICWNTITSVSASRISQYSRRQQHRMRFKRTSLYNLACKVSVVIIAMTWEISVVIITMTC